MPVSLIHAQENVPVQNDQPNASSRRVVVTATRTEVDRERVASSISVIDSETIQRSGAVTVADLLRIVPGVDVVRSGPVGGNVAVFLRGANSEHTLVLIDGVEANDPISPTRVYNFADFPAENIERIEILRGPQSTLYGSDAMGGVIALFTKKGSKGTQASLSFEGGSYNTFKETAELSGAATQFNYSLSAQRFDTGGVSAADRRDGNREKDGYERNSFSAVLGAEITNNLRSDSTFRYLASEAELDNFGGIGADDPNRILEREQLFARTALSGTVLHPDLTQTLGVSVSHQNFEDNNDPDVLNPLDSLRSSYTSRLLKFDFQNEFKASEAVSIVAGLETEDERGSSAYSSDGFFGPFENNFDSADARTNSAYLNFLLHVGSGFSTSIGARVDDHSRFGSEESWKLAPAYMFSETNTRVFGSVGTGFKAPSLFQLYSSYGNPDLKPEESLGWDLGIEQQIGSDGASASLTYFHNDFDELISFNPNTFVSENIARARTEGVEFALKTPLIEGVHATTSYTYTDTEDLDLRSSLLRRPRHKAALELSAQATKDLAFDVGATMVGRSFDNDFSTFPASRVALGSHTLVHAGARYTLSENVQLFARVENLLDKSYQRVLGYGEQGLAAFGGLKVKL
jgi:vitamin B12 transporter